MKISKNILFIIFSLIVFIPPPLYSQQPFTVSGTVYDESGNTLPGASIYIKDRPGIGTISDNDGQFKIKASKGDIIVFSFIGYKNIEYRVEKAESALSISFAEAMEEMEEVVVTALGSQRKVSIVGAISTIETSELQVPATSMANILGGRISGIISVQTSGEPGKNISEFWIRGLGTFGANQAALVLIDGLEGNINSIDPADIESFSILKDASATAVYGVRGANGVVLITTKRGAEGKLKINARANFTAAKLTRMPKYLRAYEYAQLANEARSVRGDMPLYSQQEMEIIRFGLDKDLYPDVDWQKEIVNPYSFQHTYYVSAQGGGEVAKYFLSLATSIESAAYKQDKNSMYHTNLGYNTYSYRSNLDINLTFTTNVFFGIDGFLARQQQPGIANTDYIWYAQSQLTPLLVPKKYSTGHLPDWGAESNYSPYVMLNYTGLSFTETNAYKSTIALKQDMSFITSGLTFRVQGAFNTNT